MTDYYLYANGSRLFSSPAKTNRVGYFTSFDFVARSMRQNVGICGLLLIHCRTTIGSKLPMVADSYPIYFSYQYNLNRSF